MEFDILQEYESKNIEIAVKIRNNHKKDELDILEFYPEFKLNDTYTGTNSTQLNSIKPYQLLPYFKTVIVDVLPLKDEKLFNIHYGMSIDELIELERKGKAVIRLPQSYTKYENINDNYLDPILELKPPSSPSRDLNYSCLINSNFLTELDARKTFFEGKLFDFGNNLALENGMIDPLTITAFDIITGNKAGFLNVDEEVYINILKTNCQKLSLLGYKNINKSLKKILELGYGRLDWAFAYSVAYTSFLTDPIFNSLNGTHLVNNVTKDILNDLFIRTENNNLFKEIFKNDGGSLNYDLGKILTEEIITELPLSFEQSLDFDGGAIKALKSLENAVDNRSFDNITDRVHNLKTEINETDQTVKEMKNRFVKAKGYVSKIGISVAILGPASNFVVDPSVKPIIDTISLFSGVLEGLNRYNVLDPIFEGALKLKKKNHVLYLYNNYEKYDIVDYNLDSRILKSRQVFKDDIGCKYEYYEKLYNKIPILRVIIDVDTRYLIGKGPKLVHDGNIPNAKQFEEIEKWFKKTYPVEFWKIMHNHLLLYGRAYLVKNHESSFSIIDPKIIRPVYRYGKLKNYKMLDKSGREKTLLKHSVLALDPPEVLPLVEYYIPLFDEIYPKITLKKDRPKLLYDVFFKKLQTAKNLMYTEFELPKKIFEEILPISIKLKNIMWSTIVLIDLGDIYRKNNNYKDALKYYLLAQNCLENRVYSNEMEQLDLEISNKILETNKFI